MLSGSLSCSRSNTPVNRSLLVLAGGTLLLVVMASEARAQPELQRGDRIRVGISHARGVQPFVGSFVSFDSDSIALVLENGLLFRRSLAHVGYVDRSMDRADYSLLETAAMGAGIAGALTALALFARSQLDGTVPSSGERPWLAIGMGAGALPGAIVGLGVGALLRRERWQRVALFGSSPPNE